MPPRWRPPLRDVVSIMPFSFQELAIPGIHHAFMRDMAGKRDDGEYQKIVLVIINPGRCGDRDSQFMFILAGCCGSGG